jgi:serine/threonine-protein kinase
MGVVYLALMRGPGAFHKLLVLKELKPELLEDPGIIAMFMEEARLAACLSHPNVVHTIEAGSDGNRHYIAMEYLDGQPLHRVISRARRRGKPMPLELHGAILCAALEGLAYAHAAPDYDGKPLGIVHRDVSPHNVFVGYAGEVKLLDFGIAKAMNSSVDTRTGLLKGKAAYMAPEQAAGSEVDGRADVFGVGVMLWEAVTGRRFWSGMGNDMQILRALLQGNLSAEYDAAMAEVPAQLRAVIAKATALPPSQRYPSAAQFQADLREVLGTQNTSRIGPREIGGFVHELFAEDRARLQLAIDEALSSYRGPSSGTFAIPGVSPLILDAEVPSLSMPFSTSLPNVAIQQQGTSTFPLLPPATISLRAGAALPRSLGFGALILLAGLGAGVALRGGTGREPATSTASSSEARAMVGGGAAQNRTPLEKMHVVIRASPPNARIAIDRQIIFENPCVVTLPRDGASHIVHVEAEGYVPRDDSFEGTGDATLVISLEAHRAQMPQMHWAAAPVRAVPPAPLPSPPPPLPVPPAPATGAAAAPSVPPPAPPPTSGPRKRTIRTSID